MNTSRSLFSMASMFTKDYACQILVHPFDLVLRSIHVFEISESCSSSLLK